MPLEQPQSIRTIFFDAGFTLLRPHPSTPEICQLVCKELDLHIHLDQIKQAMLATEDYYHRQVRHNRHTWASEEHINELWTSYYMNMLRPFIEEHDEQRLHQLARAICLEFEQHTSWRTYPDVLPTLQALKARGYMLGIISDWGISLGPILRQLHLTGYFDCLLISAAVRHAKPSLALYETALQRANAIADYTLHIGDTYIQDVLGARAVGITPVLLDRAAKLSENTVDCLLVHSLYELLDLLEVEHEGAQA
ncbi:MAG: HAD hydrolase-like protein [Ktedonobacteraceae bacterium]|nr:HAD hydrolase-like protein [Ktedonobacteraceae bacterium]